MRKQTQTKTARFCFHKGMMFKGLLQKQGFDWMNEIYGKFVGRKPLFVVVAQHKEEKKAKLQDPVAAAMRRLILNSINLFTNWGLLEFTNWGLIEPLNRANGNIR
ncbi:hypothetical protein P8452_46197 [Trifolium repens]|nr:hypothetical protein P8452_46197 [Trifolium repens]